MTRPKPRKARLYQPKNADSLRWRAQDYKFACCDCLLVHRVRFSVKRGLLSFNVWRTIERLPPCAGR